MLREESHNAVVPVVSKHRLWLLAAVVVALVVGLGSVPAAADLISRPAIEGESVSNIAPTDATLEVQIDPGGLETTYEVWVGTVSCVEVGGPADTCESTSPGQIVGKILTGGSTQTVSIDVANAWRKLAPNASYVFSVSVSNSAGTGSANFKVFKTAAGAQPAIISESVSNITPTDATLEAQINSEGFEASYEFQLRSPECMPPAQCIVLIDYPLPSGVLLGSFVDQSVSLDLNSAGVTLRPGWEYTYSVTATSTGGTVTSREQRFTSPEIGVQPPPGSQSTTGSAPSSGQGPMASTASDHTVTPSPKVTTLTSAQKLSKALKACKRKPKRQRPSCAKQAHRKYTTATKKR